MEYFTAQQLAHALLEEADFDPYEVIRLEDEDLVDTLCNLEEDLAEALLSFCELLSDDSLVIAAIRRFAERPKDATDLLRWHTDALTFSPRLSLQEG